MKRRCWPPYVVSAYDRNHNSPAQWAAQGPLPRLRLPIQYEVRLALELPVLQVEQQGERLSEELAEQLLVRVQEQEEVEVEVKVEIQVETQVAIQMQTHVSMQASTQLRTLL